MQAKIDKLADSRRPFGHDRAHNVLVAKSRPRFERVAHMQIERIFVARDAGNAALRPRRIRIGAFAFRNHSHRAVLRRFQGKTQPRNAAADHDEIVFLHSKRMLSINRVLPKNTASASSEFGRTDSIGCKVSASTRPT